MFVLLIVRISHCTGIFRFIEHHYPKMNAIVRPSILIVEDVHTDIDVLNHILKNHYTVFVTKTGKSAIEKAISDRPDLILLDIILPDMTGFAVLKALKESSETRDIPVIIITGISNVQYEEKGLVLGAVDYITKPFHNTVVLARIKMHLQIIRYIQTIARLGVIDTLTELPNRRGFDKQIAVEWARLIREKGPLSLLKIDIDHYKDYNEKFGRPQGDVLLQTVAATIFHSFRRPADLVARIHDDEFAVLLPKTELSGAVAVAEEVRAKIEKTTVASIEGGDGTSATVSIGVASAFPDSVDNLDVFLSSVDHLLAEAKAQGGNRVVSS